jgi:hypothetical protein
MPMQLASGIPIPEASESLCLKSLKIILILNRGEDKLTKKEVMNMAFKVLSLAHAPDANPEKHRCVIDTGKYKLFTVVVKDQNQAIEVCKKLVKEEGIHSILLCPGFTHKNIAEISEAVRENVGVCVARGDGPSTRIAMEVMKREGWFAERGKE